jgi:hypothetical protein
MENNKIILESTELHKILLKELKREQMIIKKRESSRLYRLTHKEQIKFNRKANRIAAFNSNPDEYLEKVKLVAYNKKVRLGLSILPLKRGRKELQFLGDDLLLHNLF